MFQHQSDDDNNNYVFFFFFFVSTARRPSTHGNRSAGAGLVVHRLRDHVENNQTGGRSPRIFHPVQKVRRPVAAVRPPRVAAALRVFGSDHGGRFRNSEQRVQQTAAEEKLTAAVRSDSSLKGGPGRKKNHTRCNWPTVYAQTIPKNGRRYARFGPEIASRL